jgi:hypothetical protein
MANLYVFASEAWISRITRGLDGVDGPLTASMCQCWVVNNANRREPSMKQVTTIGLDLTKAVFQVYGVMHWGW